MQLDGDGFVPVVTRQAKKFSQCQPVINHMVGEESFPLIAIQLANSISLLMSPSL